MKLYLVSHKTGKSVHVGGKSMQDVAKDYPDCESIKFVADKLMINGSVRYDLLLEAYNFIKEGASTYSKEERLELEDKIKTHLAA